MQKQDIYIGVDGGASKCKVRVEKAQGELIGQGLGGPANIVRFSPTQIWENIFIPLDEIFSKNGLSLQNSSQQFHIALGLAGCEVLEAYQKFIRHPHFFNTLHLTSDAHTACVGAHAGEDGVIIIVGTGVVGLQIKQMHTQQVNGWGFPHADEGGGAWLGLEAVRLTFQFIDKRHEKTALLEEIFQSFQNNLNELVTWANRANSTEFASFAPLVVKHAQEEDLAALALMQRAAREVERVAGALDKNLPCVLLGGLAAHLEPWLNANLRARLTPAKISAESGAIHWLKHKLRMQLDA